MNQMTPEFLKKALKAFTDNPGVSLKDVRDKVAALPASTRRRDTLSALDAVQKLFKKDLAAIPANWLALRNLFESHNGAQLGVTAKRYANIRSEIVQAVKTFGAGQPSLTKRVALTPEWSDLLEKVPSKRFGHALKRLASFCSIMGIAPGKVDAEMLLAFHEALVAEEVIKNPRRILKHTIAHWGMCQRQVPGWPANRLASPFPTSRYMLDLKDFPASFQKDVARWRSRLLREDLLDDEGPDTALRLITVNGEEKLLRRFATALVVKGTLKSEAITRLAVLLEIDNLKSGLRFFLDRAKGKPTGYIRKFGHLLLSVARHHAKLSEEEVEAIRKVVAKLGKKELGMTARNRLRLEQFDDPGNMAKLLNFPMEERERGLKVKNHYRRAKYFERAAAAGILIYASVRMQNLRTIQIGKNIRHANGKCILSYTEDEMKNGRSHEVELPQVIADIVQEFIRDHRARLPGSGSPYLFAGKDGGPRSHNTMRSDFETAVFKHTGLKVNPHFMRHATAMHAINEDPANLPTVSQLLGHKSMKTTQDFYLGNVSLPASRVMNEILAKAAAKHSQSKRRK